MKFTELIEYNASYDIQLTISIRYIVYPFNLPTLYMISASTPFFRVASIVR